MMRASEHEGRIVVDVSVLTPSLNYGRFIEDAVLSARHQRGLSVQHIVKDGGSKDDTLDVLSRFSSNVDWSSQPDVGQSQALNRALGQANGRWITWLNADDFYLPGSLEHLLQAGERSGADVVYGDCVLVDEPGSLVRLLGQHRFDARVLMKYGCYISSNSTIFRRSALGEKPFDESLRKIMDWDLFMRLQQNGATFKYVPYPVGAFRMHPDQVTAAARDWHREYTIVMSRYQLASDIDHLKALHKRFRWLHLALKAHSGSYRRQVLARSFRGSDIRWFKSSAEYATSIKLLERCYGLSNDSERLDTS